MRNAVHVADDQTLLPLLSLPNDGTVTSLRAGVAQANARVSSATHGRPPVMSRVFEVFIGIRASMSPALLRPSFTRMMEPIWNVIVNWRIRTGGLDFVVVHELQRGHTPRL